MGQSNKIMESSYGVNFLHKNECTQLHPSFLVSASARTLCLLARPDGV